MQSVVNDMPTVENAPRTPTTVLGHDLGQCYDQQLNEFFERNSWSWHVLTLSLHLSCLCETGLKLESHWDDKVLGPARTCHDMGFRSNHSFNSTSWQCPRWCPSNVGVVLAGSPLEATSWQILVHVQVFATTWQLSHDKKDIGDVSATCPSRDWNVLAVSGGWSLRFWGFRRPRHAKIYSGQTQDAARTRFLSWPYHVTGGFPERKRGHIHQDEQTEDAGDN